MVRSYKLRTARLSKSQNSKVIIIGSGQEGMPIILGAKLQTSQSKFFVCLTSLINQFEPMDKKLVYYFF